MNLHFRTILLHLVAWRFDWKYNHLYHLPFLAFLSLAPETWHQSMFACPYCYLYYFVIHNNIAAWFCYVFLFYASLLKTLLSCIVDLHSTLVAINLSLLSL